MKRKIPKKLWLLTSKDLNKEIELTCKKSVDSLLYQMIDKCGSKKVLALVGRSCGIISGNKVIFPSSYFATNEDEDNISTMIIIRYVLENWEQISNDAMKYWKNVVMPRVKENEIKNK